MHGPVAAESMKYAAALTPIGSDMQVGQLVSDSEQKSFLADFLAGKARVTAWLVTLLSLVDVATAFQDASGCCCLL